MLDRTLPYFNVFMKRTVGIPIANLELPPSFFYDEFREGSEEEWAEIVTSVGEFETVRDAVEYLKNTYGSSHTTLF